MEISSSTGNRRELLAAEMHLKSIIRQASMPHCLFEMTLGFSSLQFVVEKLNRLNKFKLLSFITIKLFSAWSGGQSLIWVLISIQAGNFVDTREFSDIQCCLNDVKKKLESVAVA